MAEVAAEIGPEPLVGVETEELADDLDRQDLTVGELRGGAPLAQSVRRCPEGAADEVVGEAEHRYDEPLEIHDTSPRRRNRLEGLLSLTLGALGLDTFQETRTSG
jgi:hypothetical protein